MNRQQLGLQLKARRIELKLSKTEISRKTGLSREQVQWIEQGSRNYTIDSLILVLNVIDLHIFFSDREGKQLDRDQIIKILSEQILK